MLAPVEKGCYIETDTLRVGKRIEGEFYVRKISDCIFCFYGTPD